MKNATQNGKGRRKPHIVIPDWKRLRETSRARRIRRTDSLKAKTGQQDSSFPSAEDFARRGATAKILREAYATAKAETVAEALSRGVQYLSLTKNYAIALRARENEEAWNEIREDLRARHDLELNYNDRDEVLLRVLQDAYLKAGLTKTAAQQRSSKRFCAVRRGLIDRIEPPQMHALLKKHGIEALARQNSRFNSTSITGSGEAGAPRRAGRKVQMRTESEIVIIRATVREQAKTPLHRFPTGNWANLLVLVREPDGAQWPMEIHSITACVPPDD